MLAGPRVSRNYSYANFELQKKMNLEFLKKTNSQTSFNADFFTKISSKITKACFTYFNILSEHNKISVYYSTAFGTADNKRKVKLAKIWV